MTRALPRTNFNSSKLIRFLADLSVDDVAESSPAFAERLGEWLDFSGAIALSTLLGTSLASSSAVQSGASSVARLSVEAEFARIRTTLVNSIAKRCSSASGLLAVAAAYEPYRRIHFALQREMESGLRPLRALVREALSKASPALRQLASLDAAMDKILSERERTLFSTVPFLLEKRFGQLLKAHQQAQADSGQADNPALWTAPGGWLTGFDKELQAVLLAELDVRLQPIIGLIEAFSNEASKDQ